jgi:NAD(P)H-dependent FMN reductase
MPAPPLRARIRRTGTRQETDRMGLDGQSDRTPTLMIVVASIRDGRAGLPVGTWFEGVAREHGDFDVTVADLKEIDLPLMTEPNHPRMKKYTQPKTWAWSERVEAADAFVFVMPEYNYGATAPLINAIDYLSQEWRHKPVGLVSYGGVSGGLRGAQHIKQKVTTLGMMPLPQGVTIQFVNDNIEDGVFQPNEAQVSSAGDMLDALRKWESALHTMREPVTAAAD